MKQLVIITLIFLSASTAFAQEEWGSVDKNKVTLKEIGPVWPGCESGDVAQRSACFDRKLQTHIVKNFKYPAEAYKRNEQGKVVVHFVVNKKGLVEVTKVTGATKALRAEAKRNIMSIPKMVKPGMMGGKPQTIAYTVPFTFKTGK